MGAVCVLVSGDGCLDGSIWIIGYSVVFVYVTKKQNGSGLTFFTGLYRTIHKTTDQSDGETVPMNQSIMFNSGTGKNCPYRLHLLLVQSKWTKDWRKLVES